MAAFTALASPTTDQISQALFGADSGITIVGGSLSVVSGASSIGTYDGSLDALGIGSGLILTSGTMPGVTNTIPFYGVSNGMAGDAQLDQVVQSVFQTNSLDATSLSFSFNVDNAHVQSVSFKLVFGSDEFPEWVNQYVDIAGVFVNGKNYAYFDNNHAAPLSVIGSNLSANYFQDNADSHLPIEYDGVSGVLTISAPVVQGLNTIKIAIADTRDHIYDSGIIISGMTTSDMPVEGVKLDYNGDDTDNQLDGSQASEYIQGYVGNDDLKGEGGDDVLSGGDGNDSMVGGLGDDVIDGGSNGDGSADDDTAFYAGNYADFSLTTNPDGSWTIVDQRNGSPEGTDILRNVEHVRFNDVSLDLATGETTTVDPWTTTTPTPSATGGSTVPTGGTEAPVVAPVSFAIDEFQDALPKLGSGEIEAEAPEVEVEIESILDDTTNTTKPANAVDLLSGATDADGDLLSVVTDVTLPLDPVPEGTTAVLLGDLQNDPSLVPFLTVVSKEGGFQPIGYYGAMVYVPPVALVVVDPDHPDLDALAQGETRTFDIVYGVSDGVHVTTAHALVTITGTNDAPTVDAVLMASATEGDAAVSVDALAGAHDVDHGTDLTIVASPDVESANDQAAAAGTVGDPSLLSGVGHGADDPLQQPGTGGAIVFDGTTLPAGITYDASIHSFVVDPSDKAFDWLSDGESTTIVIKYGISDGVVVIPQEAHITLVGTNDVPTVVEGSLTVTETAFVGASAVDLSHFSEVEIQELEAEGLSTGQIANGINLLAGVTDPDHLDVPSVSVDPASLPRGVTFHAVANALIIDPSDAAFDHLQEGEPLEIDVPYTVTSGKDVVSALAHFTVIGTNDAPMATGWAAPLAVSEGAPAILAIDPLAHVVDADDDPSLLTVALTSPLPAGLTFDGKTFSFDPGDPAYKVLAQGQTETVSVFYTVTDPHGASTATSLDFIVTGVNQAPEVTGVNAGTPNEGGNDVTVNALSNVFDPDDPQFQGHGLSVVGDSIAVSVAGVAGAPDWATYGLSYDAAGMRFTLDPNAAVYNAMSKGDTLDVVIDYAVTDGYDTVADQVVFTVTGRNDAPIVLSAIDKGHVAEGAPIAFDLISGVVTDADAHDTLAMAINKGGSTFDLHVDAAHSTVAWSAPIAYTVDAAGHLVIDKAQFGPLGAGQHLALSLDYQVTDGTDTVSNHASLVVDGADNPLTLIGTSKNDVLKGGGAGDLFNGQGGDDSIDGGDGNDVFQITGNDAQNDSIAGGGGDDILQILGTKSATLALNTVATSIEFIQGNGQGLLGTGNGDIIDLSNLKGFSSLPFVDAGSGNDQVTGSGGDDNLRGNSGADVLRGGAGKDILDGGAGNDVLTGGADADIFAFDKGGNSDRITDFTFGEDKVQVTKGLFADMNAINAGAVYSAATQTETLTSKAGVVITIEHVDHVLGAGDFLFV